MTNNVKNCNAVANIKVKIKYKLTRNLFSKSVKSTQALK